MKWNSGTFSLLHGASCFVNNVVVVVSTTSSSKCYIQFWELDGDVIQGWVIDFQVKIFRKSHSCFLIVWYFASLDFNFETPIQLVSSFHPIEYGKLLWKKRVFTAIIQLWTVLIYFFLLFVKRFQFQYISRIGQLIPFSGHRLVHSCSIKFSLNASYNPTNKIHTSSWPYSLVSLRTLDMILILII